MSARRSGRFPMRVWAATLLAGAGLCLPALAQGTRPTEIEVVNEEYGFTFKVPAKFEAMPPLSAGGILHGFALIDDSAKAGAVPTTIQIQKLPPGMGLQGMGRIRVPQALLPKGMGFQMETRKWQGRDVTAMCTTLRMEDTSVRTISVQIPLQPQPIMLTVMGDASRKDEIDGYVTGILDSLQGQAAPASAGSFAIRRVQTVRVPWYLLLLVAVGAVVLIVSVIVVIVIVVATRSKRSRRAPPTLRPSDPQ